MEILDLYDKDKKITNLQISRGVKVPKGYYRLVVHICIFNNKGEMLIQKRASYKKWGDKWDISVGGCVSAGETSDVAAMREVKEEIGLDIDLKDKRCNFTFNFDEGFDDIFLVTINNLDLNTLSLQPTEVQSVKWATRDEIIQMIRSDDFISYYESYINLLFEFQNAPDLYQEFKENK
jgi:isopentenyldiphosphate isomerase